VNLKFRDAKLEDVPVITGLQNAASGSLTARFGDGPWSGLTNERGTEIGLRHARVRVGRIDRRIVTVLRLASKKPWAIEVAYFTPVRLPLYLTGMAVSVAHMGKGLGREALEDAAKIAREWPADAIRLDAYEGAGGASEFYKKCGFSSRGRAVYKGTPLLYFELLLK
jgi:GNAT superfamily N-acetyltransferase